MATPKQPVPPAVAPPTTTAQQDIVTAGQRKINLIWEVTQATIALMSVGAGVFIFVYQALQEQEPRDLPTTLSSMIFLVLGFYYARTNHEKVGGVGPKSGASR